MQSLIWSRSEPTPLRRLDDVQPVPWLAAVGVTREVVSYRESRVLTPGRPPWRLSVADLHEPGPFSRLPGLERTFVPVDGAVTLRVDDRLRTVAAGTALSFSGSAETILTSLTAPLRAVNLMTAAGALDPVELVVCRHAPRSVPAATLMMPLTTGRRGRARPLDLYGPGARLGGLRVRRWLAIR